MKKESAGYYCLYDWGPIKLYKIRQEKEIKKQQKLKKSKIVRKIV
jgi:hypothetical protein